MKPTSIGRALLALLLAAPGVAGQQDGCIECHGSEDMTERGRQSARLFAGDVHDAAGIGCIGCHGGNPESDDFMKAHDFEQGFRGQITGVDTPEVCASCHDDPERMRELGAAELPTGQADEFRASVHGEVNPVEGFEVPNCASCHRVHGTRSPDDTESQVHPTNVPQTCNRCHGDLAYMRAFTSARVRVDQLIEYRTSVHGQRLEEGDAKVAVCSSCHGNHSILPADNPNSKVYPTRVDETCGECHSDPEYMSGYEIEGPGGETIPLPTDQQSDYRQSVHHAQLEEEGDLSAPTCNDCHGNHGATPPEVRTVATVCAQCHSRPAELYEQSGLDEQLAAESFLGCASCHGHHQVTRPDDSLLLRIADGETTSHWEPPEQVQQVAASFHESIQTLERRIEAAEAEVARAENYGMDMTRANLRLNQARDQLVRARVAIHSLDPEAMETVVHGGDEGPGGLPLAEQASQLADEAFEERAFRRQGLAVALAIIVALIVALLMKIRRMEAHPDAAPG